jgi:hypothetical protein
MSKKDPKPLTLLLINAIKNRNWELAMWKFSKPNKFFKTKYIYLVQKILKNFIFLRKFGWCSFPVSNFIYTYLLLQPICLKFLILPSSGKSKIEDHPQIGIFVCAVRLASKLYGIIFKDNSHPPGTLVTEPASESVYSNFALM